LAYQIAPFIFKSVENEVNHTSERRSGTQHISNISSKNRKLWKTLYEIFRQFYYEGIFDIVFTEFLMQRFRNTCTLMAVR